MSWFLTQLQSYLLEIHMGSFFRSQDMTLVRLYFDRVAAHDTIDVLGHQGIIQFKDLNDNQTAFSRAFASNVRQCEEMQRRLRFLEQQAQNLAPLVVSTSSCSSSPPPPPPPPLAHPPSSITGFIPPESPLSGRPDANARDRGPSVQVLSSSSSSSAPPLSHGYLFSQLDFIRLDELDAQLKMLERSLTEMNQHWFALQKQHSSLLERKFVLEKGAEFFQNSLDHSLQPQPRYVSDLLRPKFIDLKQKFKNLGSPFRAAGGLAHDHDHDHAATGEELLSDPAANAHVSASVYGASGQMLSYLTGAIETDKCSALERVLFRVTRGNCIVRFSESTQKLHANESHSDLVDKSTLIVFFTGESTRTKIEKIAHAFQAKLYPFPDSHHDQLRLYATCRSQLDDIKVVLDTTASHRAAQLQDIASKLPIWKEKIAREKAIYHTLNLFNFDTSHKLFIAEGWCFTDSLEHLQDALNEGRKRSNAQVPSVLEERKAPNETPPTGFKINKFTRVFHDIVESYGVAQYHEVNPAPFAVITFPFLFAVMFGDIGHGFIMAFVAALIILLEKKFQRQKLGEMFQTVFAGRYIILLMGLFSIYTGFIYNEFFAIPLDIFGSRWKFTSQSSMACGIDNCQDPAAVHPPFKPYPFGFDPIWKSSQNSLLFFNSYKMKLSILLGVSQMTLGLCLSAVNATYFREPIDILFGFIPQLLFLLSIFGYLCLLILIKWFTNWDSPACSADPTCNPPDIKAILIAMFMSPGRVGPEIHLYTGQAFVQVCLLLLALVCIPWMLLPKPLILRVRYERKKQTSGGLSLSGILDSEESQGLLSAAEQTYHTGGGLGLGPGRETPTTTITGDENNDNHNESDNHDDDDDHHHHNNNNNNNTNNNNNPLNVHSPSHEPFDFSDVFVHQCIHTIEFVLGAVSNTASYLRLWALSLAHAQLSDVFLEKVLYMTFETGSPVAILIGFFLWMGATIGVLMLMESLSAFLHTLRLHWVEFQNKFYNLHGPGQKFLPFEYRWDDEE